MKFPLTRVKENTSYTGISNTRYTQSEIYPARNKDDNRRTSERENDDYIAANVNNMRRIRDRA